MFDWIGELVQVRSKLDKAMRPDPKPGDATTLRCQPLTRSFLLITPNPLDWIMSAPRM